MPVPGGRRAGPGCLLTPFLAWNAADFFFLSENGRAYGQEGVAGGKARRTCSLWGKRLCLLWSREIPPSLGETWGETGSELCEAGDRSRLLA